MTSSSSLETITTATPSSRIATIWRCMNSIEPTSSPRVGWAQIRTLSSRESSRAITTFCWLPPERELSGSVSFWARTSYSAMRFLPFSSIAFSLRPDHDLYRGLSNWSRTRLSAIDSDSTRPWRCRSSGT